MDTIYIVGYTDRVQPLLQRSKFSHRNPLSCSSNFWREEIWLMEEFSRVGFSQSYHFPLKTPLNKHDSHGFTILSIPYIFLRMAIPSLFISGWRVWWGSWPAWTPGRPSSSPAPSTSSLRTSRRKRPTAWTVTSRRTVPCKAPYKRQGLYA